MDWPLLKYDCFKNYFMTMTELRFKFRQLVKLID